MLPIITQISLFFCLILLVQQPVSGAPTMPAGKGAEALAAGLWEVAELHFRESLADPTLAPEAKAEFSMRLGESLIRSGNPAEALPLLDQSFLSGHPELPFWKALALAALGRYQESADLLGTLTDSPHRIEAGFTRASLQLALGAPDAALETLTKIIPGSDAATTGRIKLYQVEILLDLDRTAAARESIPAEKDLSPSDRPLATFLTSQLLLKEGRPVEAEAGFRTLVETPQGQSLPKYHAAVIGLADAIAAQSTPEAATQILLKFLQENSDTPLLDPIFERIIQWLPAKPTLNDPTLEQITAWIAPPVVPALGPIAVHHPLTGAGAAWPSFPAVEPLMVYSLYARAIGIRRMGTIEARAEADRILNRLRLENPDHPLADRALFQLARWTMEAGSTELAFSILDTLRTGAGSHELRGQAAFLEARAAYLKADPQQAIQLFDEAAALLSQESARLAKLQAAIARLRSGSPNSTTLILNQDDPDDQALAADLELERALTTAGASERLAAIQEFLTRFPEHPRTPEARLIAAEAALASPAPDLASARAQLDALASNTEHPATLAAPRIALARLRIADLSGDAAAVSTAAQGIIETYPELPEAAEAALTLGRNLFQSGDYNPARLVLEKLAASDTDPTRAQVAWLLAARSAALGGTPQSKEEALILFDNAIASKGPVTAIANLEKARHLVDMDRLPEATGFLRKWIATLVKDDPLHLPAGLLLGEALYAQGSTRPASLLEALAVYDQLLTHAKTHPSLLNRLQYLRGNTLEQLPDEKDPARKRDKEAIQAYYSVLETSETPVEWEYFERCGFKALALLEKAGRWPVAITVAKKIASFKGPRAQEAATRARQLQLKHMHWED